jgi:TonB family protein
MARAFGILLFAPFGLCLFAADLDSLMNSARAAKRQGDFAAAQSAYDSAFELALEEPARRLTATAVEVATFYSQQKNGEKAIGVLRRAVDEEDRAKVPLIREVSVFLSLADLYSRERRPEDQVAILERIVQTWETAAGPNSAVVANSLYRLSNAQQATGNLPAAEESIKRAITILANMYGDDSAATGHALSLLSNIAKKLGNTDAAAAAADRAAAINRKQDAKPAEHVVGKSVSAPHVLSRQDPPYSEEARKARIQGAILLSLVVDESGSPQDIKILLPLGDGLDEEALEAVGKWRFQPGMKNGSPVAVQATIEVNFRLL